MNHGRVYDHSGSITAGSTSQQAIPLNESRKWLFLMNPLDASETLYIGINTAASVTAKTSIELSPGGSLTLESTFVPIDAINVTAATTGHKFIAKEGV